MSGYGRETTPNLEGIGSESAGQAFTNCLSHAIWSLPSDASILTGTYPSRHGAGMWNETVPSDIPTVAERFARLGYRTIGVSQNAYCSESTGLDRGFEDFEWVHRSNLLRTAGPRIVLKYLLRLRSHSAGYTAPPGRQRSEYLAAELAKQKLTGLEGSDDPFFMFVHTLGTHLPYLPPLPYRDAFTDDIELPPDEAAEVAYERSSNYFGEIADGCTFSPEVKEALDAMYDGVLGYVDSWIGAFFEHVRSLDLGPTVVVVTADHGDLLGEQGVLGHQLSVHHGLVNVPLVIHGPTSLTDVAGDSLIQHIDVMRGLLRDAGASAETLEELDGVDPRQETRDYALSQRGNQTYETAVEQVQSHDPAADLSRFPAGLVHAVSDAEFKLVHSERGEALYDLPDEETDVAAEHPSAVEDRRSYLDETVDQLRSKGASGEEREMSDAMKSQLADLGYVTE